MRFNDIMQTVLAFDPQGGTGATTLWRQCIDLLAQFDRATQPCLSDADRDIVIARLHEVRPAVSEARRIASVVELGSRLRSRTLVEFFVSDRPSICVAAMARARLDDATWAEIVPGLGPIARHVLRGRRDLGQMARAVLEHFGKADMLLAAPAQGGHAADAVALMKQADPVAIMGQMASPPDTPVAGSAERSQISELVERIEKFKSHGGEPYGAPSSVEPVELPRHFPFETDATGCLVWVGDASRAALIGLSIGEPALPGATGPDGNIAGAFARRSSFQHGRFWIGEGGYGGEWRLSATPFFDRHSGRFLGYRGQARRPLIHEVPYAVPSRPARGFDGLSPDSMRQLIHELRTPLNAILGFAEIIEQQLFGPADVHYREMAGHITIDARRLLAAFDGLDLAARSSAGPPRSDGDREIQPVRIAELIEDVVRAFNQAARAGEEMRPSTRVTIAAALPPVLLDPGQGERMIQHLLRTLLSVSGRDEPVRGSAWFQPDPDGGRVVVAFDRPACLRGVEEARLLDPGYGEDGEWPDAPLLGLGFSLRLIRSLAIGQGGGLLIEPERIMLAFPVVSASAGEEASGG